VDQPRVVVMARAPVAGTTKTRLEPLLGADGCARLQAELVRHTVAVVAALAPTSVAVAGDLALVVPLAGDAAVFAQPDGSLGERMTAAVLAVRSAGRGCAARGAGPDGPVVVVGTDCPQLGGAHLDAALARIAGGVHVVFGPARDGGYYLVALGAGTAPAAVFDLPAHAWGGPDVLALSLAAAARAGLRTATIDVEDDLDTPDDAATALADPRVPPHVAALLQGRRGRTVMTTTPTPPGGER